MSYPFALVNSVIGAFAVRNLSAKLDASMSGASLLVLILFYRLYLVSPFHSVLLVSHRRRGMLCGFE